MLEAFIRSQKGTFVGGMAKHVGLSNYGSDEVVEVRSLLGVL